MMNQNIAKDKNRFQISKINLDALGVSGSSLCLIHCLATPILVSFSPLLGETLLENEWYEGSFIIASVFLAFTSLKSGYKNTHRSKHPFYLLLVATFFFIAGFIEHHLIWSTLMHSMGSLSLASAHIINWKMGKERKTCPA